MGQTTIKYERKRLKLTQSDMAEILGITAQAYGKKENGNRKFTPIELLTVCNKLKINPKNLNRDSLKL